MAVVERNPAPTLPLGAMWLQVAGRRKGAARQEIGTARAIRYARLEGPQSPRQFNLPGQFDTETMMLSAICRVGAALNRSALGALAAFGTSLLAWSLTAAWAQSPSDVAAAID